MFTRSKNLTSPHFFIASNTALFDVSVCLCCHGLLLFVCVVMAWIRAMPFGHHDGDNKEMEMHGNLFYSQAGGG
jgi:hypothetical protein